MNRIVGIVLVAVLIAGCESNPSRKNGSSPPANELVQRHLDLGIGYLRNGDYTRAKEKLGKALELDSKNSAVHSAFGLVFQVEGETELAEKYFKSAVKYDPDSAQARNSYGAFLFAERRYHEAVEQLSKASENRFYPNRSSVFENLGVAYKRIGDIEGAEYAFTRAMQLNPQQSRALIELSEMRYNKQNYVGARDLYRRYEQVAPATSRSLWMCVRLARIFRDQNEEASCSEALEGIFPGSEEYRQYKEST